MPITVKCKKCGHVLLQHSELPKYTYPADWVQQLYLDHNGKCPECGHRLPRNAQTLAEKLTKGTATLEIKANPATLDKPIVTRRMKRSKAGRPKGSKKREKPYRPVNLTEKGWPP